MSQEPTHSTEAAPAAEQAETEQVNNATQPKPRKRRASDATSDSADAAGTLFTNNHGAERFWLHKSCEGESDELLEAIRAEGGMAVKTRASAHFSLFATMWQFPDEIEAARLKSASITRSTS